MTIIIAHVSDLHVNSSVALMPPSVQRDDGQVVTPSRSQQWLWRKWLDYWKLTAHYKNQTGAKVVGIINGDWGDINVHDKGGQLIEPKNKGVVIRSMVDAVAPMREVCDVIIVIRGTEAHTGGAGWIEDQAAEEIGAVENAEQGTHSWYYFKAEFEGVRITSAHHPGTNSTVPWTAGNEANRRAARDVYNYERRDWKPALTLWGHYHHSADSYDTHSIRAIYNRCWKLKDAFSHRIGLGGVDDRIGALWVFCKSGRYEVVKRAYLLPQAKPWTMPS